MDMQAEAAQQAEAALQAKKAALQAKKEANQQAEKNAIKKYVLAGYVYSTICLLTFPIRSGTNYKSQAN
jgi:sortase (surface protein transpeptidase)